jgi:hypothetical protein
MTTVAIEKQLTMIDALRKSFTGALRSPEGVADPVALLWTDVDGQWRSLVATLRSVMPELYTLGKYDPENRTGPVIWLKCVVDRTLPDVAPPEGVIPILYLPGVSRQELRAGGDCPRHLQPLIELLYRGAVWHQRNGRDWTLEAFLTSDHGLGLDMALDARTREAMMRALPRLATTPIETLNGRRLEAEDFDRIVIGDPVSDLLGWMSFPEAFQKTGDQSTWQTFRNVCQREFGFDPDKDGPLAAGDLLLHGGGVWDNVWRRFCEAPRLYPGISQLLRGPARDLLVDPSRRPAVNEEQEATLRRDLEGILALPHREACDKIIALDEKHRDRRIWVWAEMGESPLAIILEPLCRLAQCERSALGGATLQGMAAEYASHGWRCDRAVLDALALTKGMKEAALIHKIVRALYEPWLDQSARQFQSLMDKAVADGIQPAQGIVAEKDTCILFVDSVRFDIGAILQERLEGRGLLTRLGYRFAPLPTVTATAKPLASPVHDNCKGGGEIRDFTPMWEANGQQVTAQRIRDELAKRNFEVMDPEDTYTPTGSDQVGWTEIGRIDELGHSLECRVVQHIDTEVDEIANRVVSLLGAGWQRVRIVTDHGWLLLPGGLPKVELPPYLVATKWARCAAVQGDSKPDVPTYPWYWNPDLRIASPPGIGSFFSGVEFAHGGVSVQECVIPDLVVEPGAATVHASIAGIQWRGMRCRVTVDSNAAGLVVDLRLNWKQAETSIAASAKEVGSNGECSLAVADDRHEGAAATVVVYDKGGQVLDYKPTTVGEEQ